MMVWWSGHIEKASQGNLSLASGFKALKVMEKYHHPNLKIAGSISIERKTGESTD